MANNDFSNSENILVKLDENNLVYLDPNSIIVDGKIEPRSVKHENLVMYVNLEADIVPRSRLLIDKESNLYTISQGTFNMLRSQNGTDGQLNTDWTESYLPNNDDETGQSFGMTSVNIDVRGANFIPQIEINFVDVRGKSLFESGNNSPYRAFFHLPWPIFYLTVKGYYGKAIKYRLHLVKISTAYNETSGNFETNAKFVGSTFAFMSDIPLQGMLNAPYMFMNKSISEESVNENSGVINVKIFKSSKGYALLKSVYDEMKAKKYIPENFPVLTLRELGHLAGRLDVILEKKIYDEVLNPRLITALKDYGKIINKLKTSVNSWKTQNVNLRISENINGIEYYNLINSDNIRGKLKNGSLEKILNLFNQNQGVIIDTFNSFLTERNEINEKLLVTKLSPITLYYKENYNNINNTVIAINKLISDIEEIEKLYVEQDNKITNELEKKINTVVKDPNNGIGFDPTVRNVFAIVLANAEVYIRLMREVHEKAFAVGEQRKNIIRSFNKDETNGESIYPWPEIKKKSQNGENDVIAYPAEPDLRVELESYDRNLWPEVEFVEEYIAISTNLKDPLVSKEGGIDDFNFVFVNDLYESKVNDVSTLFLATSSLPYVDKTISSVIYELFERAKSLTLVDSYPLDVINELANAEFLTIKEIFSGDSEIVKILKEQINSVDKLKETLLNVSPYEKYRFYVDGIPTTNYINNLSAKSFLLKQYENKSKSNRDLTLYSKLGVYLKNYKAENYRKNIYPFNSSEYLNYLNKNNTSTELNLNEVIRLDQQIGFLSSGFDNNMWLKNENTLDQNLFTQKLKIDDNTETSILNTPYFHKQLFSDYNKSGSYGKYAGSAYLLLNSLPFNDLNDLIITTNEGDSRTSIRMSTMFKEVGATHVVPYFLILKWGAIYHRYKNYILNNKDILNGFIESDNDLTTTDIDIDLFFNKNEIGSEYESFTYNTYTATLSDESDVGIHPYYDSIFHEIINGYSHYDFDLGNESFSGKTTDGSVIYDIKDYGNTKYWTGIVDNSKYENTNRYTLLPSDGYNNFSNKKLNKPVNLASKVSVDFNDETFYEIFQSKFRLIWSDELISSNFSGRTFFSPYEYNSTYSTDIALDKKYSLIEDKRKIYDLIGTFSPDILNEFENIFIDFASENLVVDVQFKRFNKLKYSNFQVFLKELVTIEKPTENFTNQNELFSYIKNKQKEKLFTLSNELLDSDNFINFTLGNPKELNAYVFEGFYGKVNNTLTFGQYSSSQLSEGKYIDLYVGQNPDSSVNYYTEFFETHNIELSEANVLILRPLILIYAGYRKNGGDVNGFKTYVENEIFTKRSTTEKIVGADNRLEYFLTMLIPKFRGLDVSETNQSVNFVDGYNNEQLKLETYNFFKSFNDKWSAGNSIGQKLLMDEFLFLDKANLDIGNRAYLNIDRILNVLSEKNIKSNLYGVISTLISNTGFDMRALPAYVNFYENNNGNVRVQSSKNVASTLFGTFLEVDYQDSSPKILIQYVGQSSKHLADLSHKEQGYKNDSPHMMDKNNPIMLTLPEYFTDEVLAKSNKVVAFQVNVGDQYQGMFKSVKLDQSTIKNTSESFVVYENIARSESGAGTYNVDIGLYDIYKTFSYSCEVTSLGNVMIQPTMYFDLNNVPMFRGSYWITEVSHRITSNNIITSFKGSRIPRGRIPSATDSFLSSYRPLLDKVINNAVQEVKTIPVSIETETVYRFEEQEYVINLGSRTINGETFINKPGIDNSIPYNGYKYVNDGTTNEEKYIQKIRYKGEEWLRAYVVRMDGDNYKMLTNTNMSFISNIRNPQFTIQPSKLQWFELSPKSDELLFYSTKFVFEDDLSSDYLLNKKTEFLNPNKGDLTYTLNHEYRLDRTFAENLFVNGPVNIGPPNYTKAGIAMSIGLMRKLKVFENEIIYFKITD